MALRARQTGTLRQHGLKPATGLSGAHDGMRHQLVKQPECAEDFQSVGHSLSSQAAVTRQQRVTHPALCADLLHELAD